MNPILKSVSLGLMLAAAPVLTAFPISAAQAQAADPSVAQVQGFYDVLTASMKAGPMMYARSGATPASMRTLASPEASQKKRGTSA